MSLVVEEELLKIGKPAYEEVLHRLQNEYHCYLADCYEHPEYLHEIFKKIFGNANTTIVKSISKELEEYKMHEQFARFLEVIGR